MSYTYPEAVTALESIANDFILALRPAHRARVNLRCDAYSGTASVTWDVYSITVNMPVRPATSVMTQSEFEDWTAYLLHELGHPTHTDQQVWFEAVRNGHARMLNALEDVRMEAALIASGIVPNARAVLSRLISRKVAEARANGWKPNSRKEIGWTVCVLGRAANGYALEASDLAWIKGQISPTGTVGKAFAWALPALAACKSTADCLALAERLAGAIAAPQQPQGQQGQKGQQGEQGQKGEQGQQGEEAPQSPQGEQGEEGEGEQGEQGEGTSEPRNTPEGPSEGNEGEGKGKGGKGHGDGTTDDEAPVADESELIERALAPESSADMSPNDRNTSSEKAVLDILRVDSIMKSAPHEPKGPSRRAVQEGAKLRDQAAKASKQRALLARALRANETEDREGGRKAGRLDRGALSRAMAGAQNVFARREISEGFDTDVCILLDASGSMAGHNMLQALEVGLIVAQAASSVGASCTTEIFSSSGYQRAGGLASKRVPNATDFGALSNEADGGTPLSAHMARAALAQAKRAPHKRRVLFVVTDGGCDYGRNVLARMATYLEQACGVVLAHVSIGTPLSGAFRAEVQVPYGCEVSDIGLGHFVKVLQAL